MLEFLNSSNQGDAFPFTFFHKIVGSLDTIAVLSKLTKNNKDSILTSGKQRLYSVQTSWFDKVGLKLTLTNCPCSNEYGAPLRPKISIFVLRCELLLSIKLLFLSVKLSFLFIKLFFLSIKFSFLSITKTKFVSCKIIVMKLVSCKSIVVKFVSCKIIVLKFVSCKIIDVKFVSCKIVSHKTYSKTSCHTKMYSQTLCTHKGIGV